MDSSQNLIVNLAKRRLGSDISNGLGGLIISSIANGADTRQSFVQSERSPFFLHVDEFHSFTTGAFADRLSELPDYHSDDFATALLENTVSLRSAPREARPTLYAVLNRPELNDLDGEERPYIYDCLGALAILEEAL